MRHFIIFIVSCQAFFVLLGATCINSTVSLRLSNLSFYSRASILSCFLKIFF